MTKTFNEPELFLLNRWSEVRIMQNSVFELQAKYSAVLEKVAECVKSKYPGLDKHKVVPDKFHGCIGIGKSRWTSSFENWPSGLWLQGISFESLTSEEEEKPNASIWISPAKSDNINFDAIRKKIRKSANKTLRSAPIKSLQEDSKSVCFYYYLPEQRNTLFKMLLKDDSAEFINCLVSHFDVLARFIPVLDQLISKRQPKVA